MYLYIPEESKGIYTVIAVILFAAGAAFAVMNWSLFYKAHIKKTGEKLPSPGPFIGGVLISAGLLCMGIFTPWIYIFPFIIDRTIPLFVQFVIGIILEFLYAKKDSGKE